MIKTFIHIKHEDSFDNFKWEIKHIPHKGDFISIATDGPIYEVDKVLFNCFECDYEIEIYVHQISPKS